MKLERLNTSNLRDGVFCAVDGKHSDEAYDQVQAWLEGDQLKGQIARDEDGTVAGFVIYYPIQRGPVDTHGVSVYMVQCLVVKPEYEGQSVGRMLIETALSDAREHGAPKLAIEGLQLERSSRDFLPEVFLQHNPSADGSSRGPGTLFYVAATENLKSSPYLHEYIQLPQEQAVVRVDVLDCRKCYVANGTGETVESAVGRAAAEEIVDPKKDSIQIQAAPDNKMSNGIFVDGKLTFFRGPVSEDDIMNAIEVADTARRHATDR